MKRQCPPIVKLILCVLLLALGACQHSPAKPSLIIDFRQAEWRMVGDVSNSTPESVDSIAVKQAVFGAGYPDDLLVGEAATGSFTVTGEPQSAYLITRRKGGNPMIAVFSGEGASKRLLGQFVTNKPYQQLISAPASAKRNTDMLYLAYYDFQMGVLLASMDAVSLDNMQLSVSDVYEFMLQDSCLSSLNEPAVRASRLQVRDGHIVRDEFVAACGSADEELLFKGL